MIVTTMPELVTLRGAAGCLSRPATSASAPTPRPGFFGSGASRYAVDGKKNRAGCRRSSGEDVWAEDTEEEKAARRERVNERRAKRLEEKEGRDVVRRKGKAS